MDFKKGISIMTFDYNKIPKKRMVITLENKVKVEGIYLDYRITPETIPFGKQWYQIRHCDNDWIEPATLKRGCVIVNFMGTFIAGQIEGLESPGEELEIEEYEFPDKE